MRFTSYAQNFEDVILWRALGHVENGFYVDIGAQDPVVDSVSRAFYEHGWRGIHIEPTAHYAQMLSQERPDELVIQAAIGDDEGTIRFHEVINTGLSTAVRAIAEEHRRKGYSIREISVPRKTIDQVLAPFRDRDIHWMKIDVEGYERRVVDGWTDKRIRPWVLAIESIAPGTGAAVHDEWEESLLDKGYEFAYFDGLNRFYVSVAHPELLQAFDRPPNLFDGFVLSGKQSSVFPSLLNARIATLEEQLVALRQNDEHLRRIQRELAESRRQLTGSQRKLAAQYSLLTAKDKALEARDAELAVVFASLSWRLTRPLRWANASLRSLPMGLKRFVERFGALVGLPPREIVKHARLWVKNRPRLAAFGRRTRAYFFRSQSQLGSGASHPRTDPSDPTPHIWFSEQDVSAGAARFLRDLQRASKR